MTVSSLNFFFALLMSMKNHTQCHIVILRDPSMCKVALKRTVSCFTLLRAMSSNLFVVSKRSVRAHKMHEQQITYLLFVTQVATMRRRATPPHASSPALSSSQTSNISSTTRAATSARNLAKNGSNTSLAASVDESEGDELPKEHEGECDEESDGTELGKFVLLWQVIV